MTREDGVRVAGEILGGKWDHAVRARAVWLFTSGWNPEDESFTDLSRYEAAQDAEIQRRQAEHRQRMALASFANVVTA